MGRANTALLTSTVCLIHQNAHFLCCPRVIHTITTELVFNQPPASCVLPTDQLCTTVPLTNGQTGNHTYLSCRNLILDKHENLILNCTGAEASMPDGPAARLVCNATDRTCGPVICSYMTVTGRAVRGDNRGQINIFGFRVFQFQ